MILVKLRHEPGIAVHIERRRFMLHLFYRRFLPPYGNGRAWSAGTTLRVGGRYLLFRRWGHGL